jgi:nitroreductase
LEEIAGSWTLTSLFGAKAEAAAALRSAIAAVYLMVGAERKVLDSRVVSSEDLRFSTFT